MSINQIAAWTDIITATAATAFVAIGGIWSYYTFRVLKLREKAETELKRAKDELEGKAVLSVSLHIDFMDRDSRYDCPIKITATIENTGSCDTVIAFDNEPLIVQELLLRGGTYPTAISVATFSHIDGPQEHTQGRLDMLALRAGSKDSFEFLVGVTRPGLYRARFDAAVSDRELDYTKSRSGMKVSEEGLFWSAEQHFHVPPSRVAPWIPMAENQPHDTAITLLTESVIAFDERFDKEMKFASDEELETAVGPFLDCRNAMLNLRSALIAVELGTAGVILEHFEKDLMDAICDETLQRIRSYIDHGLDQ